MSLLFVSPLLAMPSQHGGCVYPNAVLTALHAAGTSIDYAWLAWPLRHDRLVTPEYAGRGRLSAENRGHAQETGITRVTS